MGSTLRDAHCEYGAPIKNEDPFQLRARSDVVEALVLVIEVKAAGEVLGIIAREVALDIGDGLGSPRVAAHLLGQAEEDVDRKAVKSLREVHVEARQGFPREKTVFDAERGGPPHILAAHARPETAHVHPQPSGLPVQNLCNPCGCPQSVNCRHDCNWTCVQGSQAFALAQRGDEAHGQCLGPVPVRFNAGEQITNSLQQTCGQHFELCHLPSIWPS